MNDKNLREEMLEFTRRSEDLFYNTVDLEDFRDKEADLIYDCLRQYLQPIPFGGYLKRYICKISGISDISGAYEAIDLRGYQEIIVENFGVNRTPAAFDDKTSKISALAKNWLTQESVKRQAVFLLGFGLNMNVGDVSEFLVKALKERDFNFKDPFEIICWYCFKNKLKFSKMRELKEAFDRLPPKTTGSDNSNGSIYDEKTGKVRDMFQNVSADAELLNYLAEFKIDEQKSSYSVTSRKWFDDLYCETKKIIADYYNRDEDDTIEKDIQEYMDNTQGSSKLSELDKKNHTDQMRKKRRIWTADDITESDAEKILCGGTPTDASGNLLKLSSSNLSKHFSNKRLSRQHLGDITAKRTAVDRFDLITLNFFLFSHDSCDKKYNADKNNQRRFNDFIDSTNGILNDCSMGELYLANPYECFLLMCMVSDDPFPNYTEIIEKSFDL